MDVKNGLVLLSLMVALVIVGCQKPKPKTEIQESFYAGGQLKSRAEMADGKLNGKAKYYFENGAIETEGSFEDNLPVGLFVSYFENGNVKSRAYYKDGKQDSITEVFSVNNALIWKAHYRSGKIVGNSYYFDDHGVIKEIKKYDSTGNIAYIAVFNKEGKVKNKFVYPHIEGPDTVSVGEEVLVTISFPFEMQGSLKIFAGLLDSTKRLKPFDVPWEGGPSESIKFKTQFESPGQHYIHYTFEHSGLKESDTLTVNKVQRRKSVFVRDSGPQSRSRFDAEHRC